MSASVKLYQSELILRHIIREYSLVAALNLEQIVP